MNFKGALGVRKKESFKLDLVGLKGKNPTKHHMS